MVNLFIQCFQFFCHGKFFVGWSRAPKITPTTAYCGAGWEVLELELVRWPGNELELVRWQGDEPPSQDDDNQAVGGRHLTPVIIATTGWQPVQVSCPRTSLGFSSALLLKSSQSDRKWFEWRTYAICRVGAGDETWQGSAMTTLWMSSLRSRGWSLLR